MYVASTAVNFNTCTHVCRPTSLVALHDVHFIMGTFARHANENAQIYGEKVG